MQVLMRPALAAALCVLLPLPSFADEVPLFRLFLADGAALLSYGEYARVGSHVVFPMPVGGSAADPRLHVVTIPASAIDWARTERDTASVRAQQYAKTRAEHDYQTLINDVAAVLNDIALTTDRTQALARAVEARRRLAEWPRSHYGYREAEVRDIIGFLDEAINALTGTTPGRFELSLVATAPAVDVEPAAGMPAPRAQLDQILRAATLSGPADRVALLQAALALLEERRAALTGVDVTAVQRSVRQQIRDELAADARYNDLSRRLAAAAARAASGARIAELERLLARIAKEDARLGHRRPDVVQALRATVQTRLDEARALRLRLDRWEIARARYREYQETVGKELEQLVKAQPHLDAIRRLDGPAPARLHELRTRLSGGAARLERVAVPEVLRATHDLFVGAWRFAETAITSRLDAALTGEIRTAWEASSAAAASLMLIGRADASVRELLRPPQSP